MILDETPFYAESGGQVGDIGVIELAKGEAIFKVKDTQKLQDAYLHYGEVVSGVFSAGCEVIAKVDSSAEPTPGVIIQRTSFTFCKRSFGGSGRTKGLFSKS